MLVLDDTHAQFSMLDADPWSAMPRDQYVFHCNLADNASAECLDDVLEEEVFIIPHAVHIQGNRLASPCDAVPLRMYMGLLPEGKEPKSPHTKKQRKATEELVELFPWANVLEERAEYHTREHIDGDDYGAACAEDTDGGACADVVLDDEVVEHVMKELDRARADIEQGKDDSVSDFRVVVLGGKWTQANRHMAFDAVQGKASGQLAHDFCTARGMNHSKRFGSTKIAFAAAGVLSRGWCHRLQYFMIAWLTAAPPGGEPFPAEVHASYAEPSEFVLLANAPGNKDVKAAIAEVREFVV